MLDDARGEVARGLECIEFACGIPTLLKGATSIEVSTGVDVRTVHEPLEWSPASRRSTSRSWSRCG
ncbi:MAG TPA: hypothetical protein VFV32_07125 [Acidimicrobiales bacterium]|nr:hypothetical protein [Acidimicrobiales bacterium]